MSTFQVLSIEGIKLNKMQTVLISENTQSRRRQIYNQLILVSVISSVIEVCAKYHRVQQVTLGVERECVGVVFMLWLF